MKVGFGYILLIVLAGPCVVIGLGKVEAATSFGLDILIGGLLTLAGACAQWCFTPPRRTDADKDADK